MKRPSARRALQVIVTCEHASNAVPRALRRLGLPAAVLASHRGWDPGALPIARTLAKALGAPLFAGRWSRLVADLNRSADHPAVIAPRIDGRAVPGNTALTPAARASRLAAYWRPYRTAVAAAVRAASRRGPVLHVSVHSFTERLYGVERRNDVGLLIDPARPREAAFAGALRERLAAAGLRVRRNFPYFGDTDALVTWLRSRLPARRYLGVEIECNQRLARAAAGQRRLGAALSAVLRAALGR